MLTKGAIGNLVNRYRAVLAKCNLINTFGSLAVASMLVLGGAGVANAEDLGTQVSAATGPMTITLQESTTEGTGLSTNNLAGTSQEDQLIIDLNGKTYTQTKPSVGSAGTKSQAAQLRKGNYITIKNGTFTANGKAEGSNTIFLIQNYSNLTLDNVILDGRNLKESPGNNYVISNNCGNTHIKGGAIFANPDGFAFDVYYNGNSYNEGVSVTVEETEIIGRIEMASQGGYAENAKHELTLKNLTLANNDATKHSTVNKGGAITISATNAVLNLENVIFAGNVDENGANDIYNEGTVNIIGTVTFDGGISGTGTIGGTGTIVVNSEDASFEGKVENGSTLTVKGSAALNDQTGGDIDALNAQLAGLTTTDENGDVVTDTDGNNVSLTASGMDEGLISGAVTVGADGKAVQQANTILVDTLDIATAAPLAVSRIVINDVRKRMGDLRDTKEEAGAWVRWEGGKLKGDSGLTNDFNTIQVGADMLTGIKNVRAGVAAAFTHGDLDHSNGSGEMETYSFSAYGTWMADNGMFADVIARVGFTNTEVNVKGMKADLDNEVLSLSGEYGWRLPVCDQFFVEPQVELTYTYVTSTDYKLDYASYDIDSVDSLIGRAGAVFGWKLPDERGSLYARASVVHEFLNDSKITASALNNTTFHEIDGEDTWLEYGIGANVKLTDSTYVWADVERTEGADIEEEWRGTVGVRFSF